MPNDVSPDDPLSRFLFNRKQYAPRDDRVKSGAFMPAPDLNLSVFQTKDLGEKKIWKIGNGIRDKKLLGRGEIKAQYVYKQGLEINPNNTPPLHANISGWPEDRVKQKEIAQELAAAASLHLYQT